MAGAWTREPPVDDGLAVGDRPFDVELVSGVDREAEHLVRLEVSWGDVAEAIQHLAKSGFDAWMLTDSAALSVRFMQ